MRFMKKYLTYCLLFVSCCILITATGLTGLSLFYKPQLPDPASLKNIEFQTPLKIYSLDGKLITEYGTKLRTPVSFDEIPQQFIDALTAVEDRYFFEHSGVEPKALARAFYQLATSGELKSGGSTLTMQAARNFFLTKEKKFIRKFREILLAMDMEKKLSKQEIFELYVNKIFLGNRAYGFQSAAQIYYGKKLNELSLAQLAMLSGLPQAPSVNNPIRNPETSKQRRNRILSKMLELELITDEQFIKASEEPVTAELYRARSEINAGHIGEMARQFVVKEYGDETAQTAGLKVYTSIISKHQDAAEKAVVKQLEAYDQRHGYRGAAANISDVLETLAIKDLSAINAEQNSALYGELKSYRPVQNLFSAVTLSMNESEAKLYTYNKDIITLNFDGVAWARPYKTADSMGEKPKTISDVLAVGDIVYIQKTDDDKKPYQLSQLPDVNSGFIAVDALDGGIRALVGSFDFGLNSFNSVTQAKRQLGSGIKPFIYSAALESGFNAASIFMDAPLPYKGNDAWRPADSSQKFEGPTRLRKALYRSKNLVSIRLLQQLSFGFVLPYLERFGFDTENFEPDLSLALGTPSVSPLEVATAYAHIANGGYDVEPYFIHHITDRDGNILYQSKPETACLECKDTQYLEDQPTLTKTQAERTLDPANIYIMDSILKDVVQQGTATRAKVLNRRDIGGKTGTTNDQIDAWFNGYIPNTIAASAWVGFSKPSTLGRREYGGRAALPIWIDYIGEAYKDYPEQYLTQPDDIVTLSINPNTGKIDPNSEEKIFEIFKDGYFPPTETIEEGETEIDDLSMELF